MNIRHMRIDDLYDVIRICNSAFLEMARWTPRIALLIIESIEREPDLQLVVVEENKIVGFLRGGYGKDSLKIHHIAVSPEYHGRGIGSLMLRKFEEIAISKGFNKITLDTPFAKGFYEKNGYKCIDIEYALIYETIRKKTEDVPHTRHLRIPDLLKLAKKHGSYKLLKDYFAVYESDLDKCFIYVVKDEIKGGIIASSNKWCKDLLEIKDIIFDNSNIKDKLLQKIFFEASLRGVRWIGYKTKNKSEYEEMLEKGWIESDLPYWWTRYIMEKSI